MHVGQGQKDKAVVHVLYYTIKVHYTQKFNITYTLSMSMYMYMYMYM